MTEAPRILPDEAVEAYVQTGLEPTSGRFVSGRGCGCPMAVVCLARAPHTRRNADGIIRWATPVYGARYVFGFVDGVDGMNGAPRLYGERRKQGYADGRAAWQAVIAAVQTGRIPTKG